jgi:hypothetical protein
MKNIFEDLVEDIPIKENKAQTVRKWLVRIGVLLICGAFILGQVKIKTLTKASNFEKSLQENTKAIQDLDKKTDNGFKAMNDRVDKVYDDGNRIFTDFSNYNKEQLKAVIDYGQINKEMLKRMLDLNTLEKTKTIENQIEQAKNTTPKDTLSIVIKKKTDK